LLDQIVARASRPGGLDDFEEEFRIVWPDGVVRWISAKGKVSLAAEDAQRRDTRLVGILRDVTLQKAAEEAHRYNEALLGHVLENLPVGVWILDKTGRIISGNPEGLKIWSGAKYLGVEDFGEYKGWRLDTGEPIRPHEWAGALAVTQRKTTLNEELEIEAFDGTHRFILSSALPLVTQADGLVGAIVVNQDITRRKLEEKELQRASEHLSTLLQISQSMASTLDLDRLLKLTIEQLEKILPYDVAAILILEQDFLEFRVVRGPSIFDNLSHHKLPLNELPLIDRFVEEREEIYFPDLKAHEHLFKQIEDMMKIPYPQLARIRSILGVPLIARKDLIGILIVAHFQPNHYPPQARILASLFANQVAIALQNAQLYKRAQDIAALDERNRLARELHDSVAQALYSINLFTDASLMAWETNKRDVVKEHLGELADLSRQAMADMRLLIFELRPPALEEVGLVAALQSRLNAVETRTGMQADIQSEGALHLSPEEEDQLYRITQEALNNVIKHAHANQVKVELTGESGCIRLVIEDDGVGFDPVVGSQEGGHGIRNIRERAEKIGARCWVESAPGQGTKVTIEVNK
jgi:signal transduction histidine kinase